MNAVVIGSGVTGLAVARVLTERGDAVTVLDDSAEAVQRRSPDFAGLRVPILVTPEPAAVRDLVAAADLVVPSPGVAPDHTVVSAATTVSTPVRAEVDLAAETAERRGHPTLLAVTGTNGKTTVTRLITAMLRRSGIAAEAAGNIGQPLIEVVADPAVDVVVVEVSSFQLEFTTVFRPRVAVFLNIAADHLDWHADLDAYAAAKARIFSNQSRDDTLVFNADDARVSTAATAARSRTVPWTVRGQRAGAWSATADALVTPEGTELVRRAELLRSGPHDLANALAAAAAAREAGATPSAIAAELCDFRGFPHRMELVGEAGDVRYVDDSKATNPHAARSALEALTGEGRVVLLAGGRNKGLDLTVLVDPSCLPRSVVGFGEAGADVADAFRAVTGTPAVRVGTMAEAVDAARAAAEPGDVVLLSPGCASFDAYESYSQRGDHFAALVRELPGFRPVRGTTGDNAR